MAISRFHHDRALVPDMDSSDRHFALTQSQRLMWAHRRTAALLSFQLWLTRQQMTSHCAPGWQMKLERPESQCAEATGEASVIVSRVVSRSGWACWLTKDTCAACVALSIRFLNRWQVRKVKRTPKKPWQLVLYAKEFSLVCFGCLSKFQFANIIFSGYSLKFQSIAAEGCWLGLNCALLNNRLQRASCLNWLLLPAKAIFLLVLTGLLLWHAQASGHACPHRLWDFDVCWNFRSIRGLHFNRQSYKPAFPLPVKHSSI